MEQSNKSISFVRYCYYFQINVMDKLWFEQSTIGIVDVVYRGYRGRAAALDLSVSLCLFFVFELAPTGPWQTPEKAFTV